MSEKRPSETWAGSMSVGAVLFVLAVLMLGGSHPAVGALVGVLAVGVIVYALFRRDRERRAVRA